MMSKLKTPAIVAATALLGFCAAFTVGRFVFGVTPGSVATFGATQVDADGTSQLISTIVGIVSAVLAYLKMRLPEVQRKKLEEGQQLASRIVDEMREQGVIPKGVEQWPTKSLEKELGEIRHGLNDVREEQSEQAKALEELKAKVAK